MDSYPKWIIKAIVHMYYVIEGSGALVNPRRAHVRKPIRQQAESS